ncbi:type II secretion system F family protein [Demequina activiva]|uniref:Pilus assembly protein TadB n=1 Tax=Demequina activiva TaxID=1582364 RepID=A0A919Q255_9MICO|nr:type II secretion system F family protein [Demequina activiva]GIG53511.1 pilus assembly protein TadB [Demequina activiva]
MTWLTLALGLSLGLGMALIASWWSARKPSLEARVAPFVRSTLADEVRRRDIAVTPFPTLERLIAPVLRDAARLLEHWGMQADLERRLRRAGASTTPEQFRAQQVAWCAGGLAVGCALALVLAATRGTGVVPAAVLVLVLAAAGAVGRDVALTANVRRRSRRLMLELPTVAELLALAVAAGESAQSALERVASSTSGELSRELTDALARVRAGARLPAALTSMADANELPALRRFADGVSTAIERGTPLAEVLRAQAQDVRAAGQQELMEEGGRREIAMMVPVVFLILPVTVVFAVFPGLVAIDLGG